ncbi:hypothetical protein NLG97_g8340 [Lecanicillium saksenae]|uniref:Uncharacterized protein n=1 Tax=Lecanicillium saksenae TaxID=468837 RepID=A0ACC1QKK6_9HYPO|nr:hypothetical protein NLG97_g8340 [Lecanicillium saksenae]
MGLLELPTEVLIFIARYAIYGLDNLALACKELHSRLAPLLSAHNELRKKYRHYPNDDSPGTMYDVLAEIAEEPAIADFMFDVNLSAIGHRDLSNPDESCMPRQLSALVSGSPILRTLAADDDELVSRWMREIVRDVNSVDHHSNRDEPNWAVPFLLSLLTNVESLIMPNYWHPKFDTVLAPSHPITQFLQLVIKRANDKSLDNAPLHKLSAIGPNRCFFEEYGGNMESIFPLMSLDSLREVRQEFSIMTDVKCEQLEFGPAGRNLERMKLVNSVLCGDLAGPIFEAMGNLRVFELSYSSFREVGDDFNAQGVINALLRGTYKSLERLVLTAGQVFPNTNTIDCSLRGFKKLKYLELSTIFFVNGIGCLGDGFDDSEMYGTEVEVGEDESEEGDNESCYSNGSAGSGEEVEKTEDESKASDNEYCHSNGSPRSAKEAREPNSGPKDGGSGVPEDQAFDLSNGEVEVRISCDDYDGGSDAEDIIYTGSYTNEKGIWCLVAHLPKSLETFVLHTPAARRNVNCVERMFWWFKERREERLPNLRTIELHVYKKSYWQDELEDCDAQVERLRSLLADTDILSKFEIYDRGPQHEEC